MKKTKQTELASWLGVTDATISEIRRGRRQLSKAAALTISRKTNLTHEFLCHGYGPDIYRKLAALYEAQASPNQESRYEKN